MNILILGSGGREHALADAYSKNNRSKKIFVAPGNDFMEESSRKIESIPQLTYLKPDEILNFILKKKIDLVDVASDEPLAKGLVDFFQRNGVPTFGPSKKSSEIEWNKNWSREFMKKYRLPIPSFHKFDNEKEAIKFIKTRKDGLVFVKASGLAGGKGVIKAETMIEAEKAVKAMKKFGLAGKDFLIEEGIVGEEFSLFAVFDGEEYKVIGSAQDHKTVFENGKGPNTGGMGCVSQTSLLKPEDVNIIKKTILDPFLSGMTREHRPYCGVLYLGGMLTKKGVKIVEFNARWGDPEAEVILPGIKTDYLEIVEGVLSKKIKKIRINSDNKKRISITACASGYPEGYENVVGKKIFGLKTIQKISGLKIFGAGIKRKDKDYSVNGGRILHLVAEGDNVFEARAKAYEAMSHLYIEGNYLHFRTDIGFRELERLM